MPEPPAKLREAGVEQLGVSSCQELGERDEVASVRLNGVLGEPPLKPEVVGELGHPPYVGGCGGN